MESLDLNTHLNQKKNIHKQSIIKRNRSDLFTFFYLLSVINFRAHIVPVDICL